jgi:hypothetical protein
MKHEWVHTGISTHDGVEGTAEIICIACKMTASFLRSTRAEDNVPGDPRNRTDCRGVAWHERNRKASRERLKRLLELGLCQTCGVNPRAKGDGGETLSRCESCRLEHNEGEKLRKGMAGETTDRYTDRETQKQSFAYGNTHMANGSITREIVAEEAGKLAVEGEASTLVVPQVGLSTTQVGLSNEQIADIAIVISAKGEANGKT